VAAKPQRRDLLKGIGASALMLVGVSRARAAPVVQGTSAEPALRKLSPTGTQYELRLRNLRAVVTEVGATLRSFQVGSRELLDTFGADEMSRYGMGQVLAPWPGRIDHGRYTFRGAAQQLPLNEVDNQNALHGLVRFREWRLVERGDEAVTQSVVLFPTEGYPYTLELVVTYRLTERGLVVQTRASNLGATPLPFGLGFHPYFKLDADRIDTCVLTLPVQTVLPTDARLIPTHRMPVGGTPLDFRKPKAIGAVKLDTTFTDLIRDKDGLARLRLAAASGTPWIELSLDASYRYVVAYSQDTLPEAAHRRRGICLEPLTCAPNAFNSGNGLLVLEPGRSHRGEWSLEGHA
jgi:aldose 1-epimerase